MTDLDHLYALADGATAGPWRVDDGAVVYDAADGYPSYICPYAATAETAAYIAALSPDVVKGLIERVREAEAALEPFARAYARWSDGGNLTGWQAAQMIRSMDATRFARAFEVYAARTALEAKDE